MTDGKPEFDEREIADYVLQFLEHVPVQGHKAVDAFNLVRGWCNSKLGD